MDFRSDPGSSWLAALIAPVSPDEFVSRYWARQPLFCRGSADRFATLLSWTVLNELLAHHWREPRRFRLARQGRDIDPASYADIAASHVRIRASDVTDQLRRGATLSFDAIDELHEPLTRLSESFETFFRSDTQINLYAAWRALHGLDLHRDNQEIFIAQLDGRKRWLLYGFTADGLDRTGLREHSLPPAGAEFDEILTPGDLLYIPRGCYHLAVPMNEPTLHVTIVPMDEPSSQHWFSTVTPVGSGPCGSRRGLILSPPTASITWWGPFLPPPDQSRSVFSLVISRCSTRTSRKRSPLAGAFGIGLRSLY